MQNLNLKPKTDLLERSYNFSLDLIKFISPLPPDQITNIITNQLLRSGTSIGANLFEAKSSSSRLEFKKFQEIALKSANETLYWLRLLKDSGKINSSLGLCSNLTNECTELAKMIAAGIIRLKNKVRIL